MPEWKIHHYDPLPTVRFNNGSTIDTMITAQTIRAEPEKYKTLKDIIIDKYYRALAGYYDTPKLLILDANSYTILSAGNSAYATNQYNAPFSYTEEFLGMKVIALPITYELIELGYETNQKATSIAFAKERRRSRE